MKGVRGGVIAKLRGVQPKVIDVHCICHLVSLVVKAAVKTIPIKVDELLVDVCYHFHHSVKRVTSLKEFVAFCSTEYKSILKHVETRWLSLTKVIQRTLDMWEPLCSYFTSHPDVEKAGNVKTISKLLNDPFTKVWFHFLSNTLVIFNKFKFSSKLQGPPPFTSFTEKAFAFLKQFYRSSLIQKSYKLVQMT